jgi:hypothetical protein
MKTFLPSFLVLGILVAVAGSWMRAADPAPLRKGKVLILKNEYTIEGDIERVGDRYCVRRKAGETWVPAERVLTLAASLSDAYVYLRGRINLDDPDERLRLARWCRSNGLQQQALAELKAAAELRPSHAETRRLLRFWQQAAADKAASAPRAASPPGTNTPPPPVALPPIEVTTESLGLFATRVQPILMNTCARCHATGRGGKFHLTQIFEDTLNNRRALERNLAAVLAEVNVNQPEASPLLIKAVSDHAHIGQAPLRDRQAAPYRTLENWVKLTVADNPQLREQAVSRKMPPEADTLRPPADGRFEPAPCNGWASLADGRFKPSPCKGKSSPVGEIDQPADPSRSPAPATTADPYDPEPFNRKMHPEANK